MAFDTLRRQWREISLEKKLGMFVAPIFVAVAAGILVPLTTGAFSGGGADDVAASQGPPPREERLQVVSLSVGGGDAPEFVDGPPGVPQFIDLTLRNTGNTVSVITGARLHVEDFALLKICEAGGGLDPTAKYDVTLPPNPTRGDAVDAKVSQQIPPNKADRFTISMNVPFRNIHDGMRLYHFSVELFHDGEQQPVNAGKAVVSVPYVPDPRYFPASFEDFDQTLEPGPVRDCYEANEAALRRFLELDSVRAPDLTEALLE